MIDLNGKTTQNDDSPANKKRKEGGFLKYTMEVRKYFTNLYWSSFIKRTKTVSTELTYIELVICVPSKIIREVGALVTLKVTQLSKYKEKLKSERQLFLRAQTFIGRVICNLRNNCLKYQYATNRMIDYTPISQTYICTLIHGCFVEISGTAISDTTIRSVPDVTPLHTANKLTICQETFDYINAKSLNY